MAKECGHRGCLYPIFSNGYCKIHQYHRTDEKYKESRKPFGQKHMERMKAKQQENKEVVVEEKTELDLWFENIANTVIKKNPYCWETGDFISEIDYRAATAHIFPKAIFPSVATHPLNFLILSPRNGAHQKTERLDRFSKMDVWKIAVERFKVFEPFITEKHKYLNEFRELANQQQELNTEI